MIMTLQRGTDMPICHLCWNTKFDAWIDYYFHLQAEHPKHAQMRDAKLKAIYETKNTTGRSKKQIVEGFEDSHLKPFIVE